MPERAQGFEHGAVEEDESLAVVVVILAGAAVEAVSIEVAGLIDQVNLDARTRQRALEDRSLDCLGPTGIWSVIPVAEIGTPAARVQAIAGQENGGGVAFVLDRAGQGTDDVAESAGLGERHRFRGDEGHMHP